MAGELVHGGTGEIQMSQLPAARGRGFWPQHEQILAADLYEAEHPGVTVKRPWETADQHADRLKRVKVAKLPEPRLNMDPSRAAMELKRRKIEIGNLELAHPEYDKLFTALASLINDLERICGLTPTAYKKGVVPKRADDAVPPELIDKLAKYKAAKEDARRKAILASENPDLLELVRDNETLPELQTLAIQRIEQLRSAP